MGGDKDGPPATPTRVDGVRQPAANKSRSDLRSRVYEADDDVVMYASTSDAKGPREVEVGAIGTGLVPALDGGTNGTCDDGEVEHSWDAPLVQHFVAEGLYLLVRESLLARDVLVASRVLRDQGAFAKDVAVGLEALAAAKSVDIGEQGPSRYADEGVLDSARRWQG